MNFPLIIYQQDQLRSIVRKRSGEKKLGEKTTLLENNNENNLAELLQKNSSKYVLLGLPEDVGVRANYGRGGAYSAWQPAVSSILNTQSNSFLDGEELLVLGHIDFSEAQKTADKLEQNKQNSITELRAIVAEIDKKVSKVIQQIVEANKIPVVIGGGHNNSYGCIKGTSQAFKKAINVVNCDAHTDFRSTEGRHSGNGFSYAFNEEFLQKYAVLGLHENYNSSEIIQQFKNNNDRLQFSTYEDIFIRERIEFKTALQQAEKFVTGFPLGLEIDLDTIQNIPSSAKTSSGILPLQARQFITHFASKTNVAYLHIAEGAPVLSHIKTDNKTGKLIAYLVSDFIKGSNTLL